MGEIPPSRYDYDILLDYDPSETITFWNLSKTYCYWPIDPIFLPELSIRDDTVYGGLSLSDESFPNKGACGAFAKSSRRLHEASVGMAEAFAKASRRLQRPRRLHEALVTTSRTLCGGATASPLRECFMKAP